MGEINITDSNIQGMGSERPDHENPPPTAQPLTGFDNQGNPIPVPVYHTPGDPNGPNQGQ